MTYHPAPAIPILYTLIYPSCPPESGPGLVPVAIYRYQSGSHRRGSFIRYYNNAFYSIVTHYSQLGIQAGWQP
ncbi:MULTISPECIES: hypothetical protein [unclassified Endozoicomonas]|uniref:hypothetical protein n=1 Tax=unclassified Endozoicomonas TaxID=2644528 RepID=UPI0021497926|nr:MULTISPECIES: hypothetical protein [unclassified Endozoicomonas]